MSLQQTRPCVLFADSFYKNNEKVEDRVVGIRFNEPVVLSEIRIIPMQTIGHLKIATSLGSANDFPCFHSSCDAHRFTFPPRISLEFFTDDLSNPSCATFSRLFLRPVLFDECSPNTHHFEIAAEPHVCVQRSCMAQLPRSSERSHTSLPGGCSPR